MQEIKEKEENFGTHEFLRRVNNLITKLARNEIERICLENSCFNTINSIYMKLVRKFVFAVYIFLVCIFHGLNLELNRNAFDWTASTIIELIVLFFVIADLVLIEYFLLKLVKICGKLK